MEDRRWRAVRQRASTQARALLKIESTGRIVIAVLLGIIGVAIIWATAKPDDPLWQNLLRTVGTFAAFALYPAVWVYEWFKAVPALHAEERSRAEALEARIAASTKAHAVRQRLAEYILEGRDLDRTKIASEKHQQEWNAAIEQWKDKTKLYLAEIDPIGSAKFIRAMDGLKLKRAYPSPLAQVNHEAIQRGLDALTAIAEGLQP